MKFVSLLGVICFAGFAYGIEYDIAEDVVAQTVGKDVRKYLKLRTSSGEFTIGGVAPRVVHVGETAFARTNGLSAAGMKDEEWAIRSFGGDLVLNGKGRGLTLAAVHFLDDECGIRWWSEYEKHVPAGDLRLKAIDRRGRPAFAIRDVCVTPRNLPGASLFQAYSLLNGRGDLRYGRISRFGSGGSCHTFDKYLPPSKHFKAHPEWYSLDKAKGVRTQSQVCLTHPEVRAEFKRQLRLNIEKDRARLAATPDAMPHVYDISQNDRQSYCECPACEAVIAQKGCSGLMLDFVNDLAESIRSEYPDVKLMTFAYNWTVEPPKDGTCAADNVIVRFCNTKSNLAGSILDPDNTWLLDMLKGWSAHAKHLAVWDYAITYAKGSKGFPLPGEFGYKDLFKAYRDYGVISVFFEHEDQHEADMWELKYRLETKLMDDPDADADRIIAEFMDEYYGAAGKKLLSYRRRLWEARIARKGFVRWTPSANAFDFIDESDLAACIGMLDEAESLVSGDVVRLARVRRARVGLDLLVVYRDRIAGNAGSERSRQALSRLNNDWLAWISRYPDKTGEWKRFEKLSTIGVPPPEKFRGQEIVDFTAAMMKDPKEHGGGMFADPTSPVGFAMKLSWDHDKSKALELPFAAGLYDHIGSRSIVSAKFDKPIGEGWQWYYIGRGRPTANSRIWITRSWFVYVNGKRFCEIWDKDWDIWVSAKFTGPKYGMYSADGKSDVWIDRVVLVKAPPCVVEGAER